LLQDPTVSLVGRNLLYFFPKRYKDLDVDQYAQNVVSPGQYSNASGSGLQTPTTRSYGINFNLTF
jgi:hypothetical protein